MNGYLHACLIFPFMLLILSVRPMTKVFAIE